VSFTKLSTITKELHCPSQSIAVSFLSSQVSIQVVLPTKLSSITETPLSCGLLNSGGIADSWLVDYQATKNVLEAARGAGASHFVLLSAICVQKPLLEFQKAKLKFEAELQVRVQGLRCTKEGFGFRGEVQGLRI
jgi:hypothetical protein